MIEDQKDHRDQEAVEVKPGHASRAKSVREPSSDECPDNHQRDVGENSLSCLAKDLAADETPNQSQHNPSQDCLIRVSLRPRFSKAIRVMSQLMPTRGGLRVGALQRISAERYFGQLSLTIFKYVTVM